MGCGDDEFHARLLEECRCEGGQPKNFLRSSLLLLLKKRAAHGYDLIERLQDFGFAKSDPGSVYRTLRALERDRLVGSRWEMSSAGPARRRYELTEDGEERGSGRLERVSDALDDVWWREEILQALFWMRGEGIADEVSPAQLVSFLGRGEEEIAPHLDRLVAVGDLIRTEAGLYRLSEPALGNAAELFARDFDDMVNRSAHGSQCSRPDCVCHSLGAEECLAPEEAGSSRA